MSKMHHNLVDTVYDRIVHSRNPLSEECTPMVVTIKFAEFQSKAIQRAYDYIRC